MAQTVVQREPFTLSATYTSGAPGGLGTVTGTFYRCAVGPRLTSDTTTAGGRGCSADLRQVGANTVGGITNIVQHVWTVTGASRTLGMFSAWYYMAEIVVNAASQEFLLSTRQSNGNQTVRCLLKPATNSNFWYNVGGTWTDTDSGVAVPLKQWFELRHSWRNTSGNTLDYKLAYRLAGSASWVTIYAATFTPPGLIDEARGGVPNEAAAAAYRGRYGMPALIALGNISERNDNVTGVTDPPTTASTWYVDGNTGDDLNYGNTPSTPWASLSTINTATRYGGILPGDTVSLADAAVEFADRVLEISTSDSTWDFNDGCPLLHEDLTGTTWTQYDATNFPHIWQCTPGTGGTAGAVIWEDIAGGGPKWMNRAVGANIAAVAATMNTNTGSKGYSYSDATKLYLVTSDNSNPNTNGRTYTRSFNRYGVTASIVSAGGGASAIVVTGASNVIIQNLYAPYARTTLSRGSDADPYNGYIVQYDTLCSGASNEIRDCTLGYWAKHGAGRTTSASNMTLTRRCNPR